MPNGYVNFKNGPWSYHPHVYQQSGLWILGGNVTYANNIQFYTELIGGTVWATNNVKFNLNTGYNAWGRFNDDSDLTLDVADGKVLDLENFTFEGSSKITKTGAGTLKLAAWPSSLVWNEGAVTVVDSTRREFDVLFVGVGHALSLAVEGTTIETLAGNAGTITIGAKNLTVGTVDIEKVTGTFLMDASVFAPGDVILSCESAELRAKVAADLKTVGVNVIEEGVTLKVGVSELVFDSKETKDLNDPKGWRNGQVPPAGASVVISGEGVEADITGTIPQWAAITVADGALLSVQTDSTLGKIAMTSAGRLSVDDAASLTLTDALTFDAVDAVEEAPALCEVTVSSGATLSVPGKTGFKNCDLKLYGSLVSTTVGGFAFGTAAADEVAWFKMTSEGGTITAANPNGVENGARIDFAVPQVGGTVKVLDTIALYSTTITYNSKDGMAFGLNNPSDEAFTVLADNTPLTVGADTTVAGGANLVLDNGAVLMRKRHSEGDTGDSNYNLIVQNKGRITVRNGGEIRAGVTRVNDNLVDGAIRLQPDEPGYVGIEILEGGIANWYKLNGYETGAVRFADGVCKFFKSYWHGWGNRVHVLNNLQFVEIPEETAMTICGTNQTYSSNNDTFTYFELESPFSGAGDLLLENKRTGKTMEPVLICGNSTCTGKMEVLPDNGTAKTVAHFADGANWAGKVVWNGRVDLVPTDPNHADAATKPTAVSFGSVDLQVPFVFRLWGGEELRNDTVNITGSGWEGDCTIDFALQGYEAKPGDLWCLGTMPKDATAPAAPSEKWRVFTEAVEGNEDYVRLMAGPASLEYNFISTESGDLTDPKNWECGYVPVGKDIVIKGAGVRATVTDAEAMPSFASIEVREGASLDFTHPEGTVTIPGLTLDATAVVRIGGEGVAPVVRMSAAPQSFAAVDEGGAVRMPKIAVAAGATLEVPGGTAFKNCALDLRGNLVGASDGKIVFGTALANETAYFSLFAEGALIAPTNDAAAENGSRIDIAVPAVGGRVVVTEPIVLKDTVVANSLMDGLAIGLNNPTGLAFRVVADNTPLNVGADTFVAGGANLVLTNGTVLFRARNEPTGTKFNYAAESQYCLYVRNLGRITVADGSEIRAGVTQGDGNKADGAIRLEPDETGFVGIEVLDGGIANWYKLNGGGKGAISFATSTFKCYQTQWWSWSNRMLPFYGLARMDIVDGSTFTFCGASEKVYYTNDETMDKFEFESPVAGGGNLVVRNTRSGKTLKAHVTSAANTCTGTIGLGVNEGTAKSELWFDNGANWAGTVLWSEGVSLGVTDDVPATFTFGAVDLRTDFPIRVWTDAQGNVTSDRINITGAGFTGNGGKVVIDFQGGVEPPEGYQFYPLGTMPKDAALPAVRSATWCVKARKIKGDDERLEYGLVRNRGFIISIY